MASKGQKFNKYSSKLKEEIINELLEGKSYVNVNLFCWFLTKNYVGF